MPREVLDSAERTLAQLEGGSTQKVYLSTPKKAVVADDAGEGVGSRRLLPLSGDADPTRVNVRSTPSPASSTAFPQEADAEPGFQLSLFQLDDPTLGAIRDKLNAADLDNMTPMQAFDLLRSMKAELGL
jgi:hypothetical protein